MKVELDKLSKKISFPIVQAVPEPSVLKVWKRLRRFITYRRKWKIVDDYILWSDYLGQFIFIPKGFIFDGASVPKPLHSILGPTGLLLLGACPHDFGYRYHGLLVVNHTGQIVFTQYSKLKLDSMFMQLCKKEGGVVTAAWIAKKAVNWFGYSNYYAGGLPLVYNDFPELFPANNTIKLGGEV